MIDDTETQSAPTPEAPPPESQADAATTGSEPQESLDNPPAGEG